jgi:hypothetical protein
MESDLRTLLAEVADHTRALLRLELELARQEVRQALVAVRRGLLCAGLGAVLAVLAIGVLVTALVAGLATVWPVWLSAALVGITLAVLGGALLMAAGRALRGESLRPKATLETIRETRQWLKART